MHKKIPFPLAFSGLLLAAIWAMLVFSACSGSRQKTGNGANAEEVRRGPTLDKMVARVYKGNAIQSLVQAEKAQVDLVEQVAVLDSVSVAIYDNGKKTGNLTSDHGFMYLAEKPARRIDKNDIVLDGNVRYADAEGRVFTAPQLLYLSRSGKILSGGDRVEMQMKTDKGAFVGKGKQFETDKELKNFLLSGEPASASVSQGPSNTNTEQKK